MCSYTLSGNTCILASDLANKACNNSIASTRLGRTIRAVAACSSFAIIQASSTLALVETVAFSILFSCAWSVSKTSDIFLHRRIIVLHEVHQFILQKYVKDSFSTFLFSFRLPLSYASSFFRIAHFENHNRFRFTRAAVIIDLAFLSLFFSCGIVVTSFRTIKSLYQNGEEFSFFFRQSPQYRLETILDGHDRNQINRENVRNYPRIFNEEIIFDISRKKTRYRDLFIRGKIEEAIEEIQRRTSSIKQEVLEDIKMLIGMNKIALLAQLLEIISPCRENPETSRRNKIARLHNLLYNPSDSSEIDSEKIKEFLIEKIFTEGATETSLLESRISSNLNPKEKDIYRELWIGISSLSSPLYQGDYYHSSSAIQQAYRRINE